MTFDHFLILLAASWLVFMWIKLSKDPYYFDKDQDDTFDDSDLSDYDRNRLEWEAYEDSFNNKD